MSNCRELKIFKMDDGTVVEEKVCENFVCKYCAGEATTFNYVGDMCLQAFVDHKELCGAYINDDKYDGYINECVNCVDYIAK